MLNTLIGPWLAVVYSNNLLCLQLHEYKQEDLFLSFAPFKRVRQIGDEYNVVASTWLMYDLLLK